MRNDIQLIRKSDNDISSELLDENKKLKLFPASHYKKYSWVDFRTFCHVHARYGIVTQELIDWLEITIDGRDAIEIGAGNGDLGYHLGIKMTDSKLQEREDIKKKYEFVCQPIIKYPNDVEKIDALDAVKKYKPKVVIASWITTYGEDESSYGSNPWGIRENKILELVDTFIIIGNLDIHGDKPILKFKHSVHLASWHISRAKEQGNNCIFVWDAYKY